MEEIKEFIFVFGSNLAGIHGAGAAKLAKTHYGARFGEGIGRVGQSYAIPTKDEKIETLPLHRIKPHIDVFFDYAKTHQNLTFLFTRIGCGLAGYNWENDILPMLPPFPSNVTLLEPINYV